MKNIKLTSKPSFWMILAYFLAASFESSSLFAPVQTIFPEENIRAVVLGSLILMITAAKRFGLYSAFLARKVIFFRSNLQFMLTVATMFLGRRRRLFIIKCWGRFAGKIGRKLRIGERSCLVMPKFQTTVLNAIDFGKKKKDCTLLENEKKRSLSNYVFNSNIQKRYENCWINLTIILFRRFVRCKDSLLWKKQFRAVEPKRKIFTARMWTFLFHIFP